MDINGKLAVLAKLVSALDDAGVTFAVGASAMLFLRGAVDSFNDIDLTAALPDAERAAAVLGGLGEALPPDAQPHYKTRFFREYVIDGVEADLIAGMVIVSDGVAHDCPLCPEDITRTVTACGVKVPLHALACWRRYYALMGRQAKAERIDDALEDRLCAGTPLYREDGLLLAGAEGRLFLRVGKLDYEIGSHPYEPCTFLLREGTVDTAVRNAFAKNEIAALALDGGTVRSVTGNDYDIGRICRLLAFASANCPDAGIDYVESRIAVERMKELAAFTPETAVDCASLGVRKISDAVHHSRRLDERVMFTADGRAYLRIKGTS